LPDTLRLLAAAALLAVPWAGVPAADVKPNPDGLPPHEIRDLHYGDVLFYFYQDDYFAAITRLLAAQEQHRVPHTEGEAELLLGGLYLSLGEHLEAGRIFDALLAGNTSEAVRNRAWYFLGKTWYERNYLTEAERALRQVSDKVDPRINAERTMLLAQIMMREGRYDDAIAVLSAWRGAPSWTAYAQFNLGVALVRNDRLDAAIPFLDSVGRLRSDREEFLALKDKANLALGFALLQAKRPAEAKPILERVRLDGPFSNKALLGAGWADASLGDFKRALVPWVALHKRNLLDSAVQESYLTVPYAYGELHADGQAADAYTGAIDSFDAELKRIDESIGEIRAGSLLERLFADDKDKNKNVSWVFELKTLPDAPESRYLYLLLASNDFQEGLKNYRELLYMTQNLESWRGSLAAFDDILDTKRVAYAERLPKTDAVLAATDLDALRRKRVDFDARLDGIERSNDVAALGTPEEQATWARLKRIEDILAAHPDDPDLAPMREKLRLMKGVVYWRLAESFKVRLYNERRSVRELNAALQETERRASLVAQAKQTMPADTGGYAARVASVRERMDVLQRRLAAVAGQENHFLQALAIETLEDQKRRIETYQLQARYALASIFDRNADGKPKATP
jgi:hypothetical protein